MFVVLGGLVVGVGGGVARVLGVVVGGGGGVGGVGVWAAWAAACDDFIVKG